MKAVAQICVSAHIISFIEVSKIAIIMSTIIANPIKPQIILII